MNHLPESCLGDIINFLITWFMVRAGATKLISLAGWSLATSVSVCVCVGWFTHLDDCQGASTLGLSTQTWVWMGIGNGDWGKSGGEIVQDEVAGLEV